MIDNETLDKIDSLFKANEFTLVLQLIKGLEVELYDVLLMLYNRDFGKYKEGWWVLNSEDYDDDYSICIRYNMFNIFEEFKTDTYTLWIDTEDAALYRKPLDLSLSTMSKLLLEKYG